MLLLMVALLRDLGPSLRLHRMRRPAFFYRMISSMLSPVSVSHHAEVTAMTHAVPQFYRR
jgi:hypothetical protein